MPADGWYVLAALNNGALDDVTGIGTWIATDSSANARQGSLMGFTDPTVVASPWSGFGSAYQFDGVNRGVYSMGINFGPVGIVPGVSGVGAAAVFTLEARVQTGAINTGVNNQAWVIAGRFSNNATGGSQPALYVQQNGGAGAYRFVVSVRDNGGTFRVLIGATTAVAANTSYIVAADYDGTTLRLYVNGALEASMALSGVETPDSTTRFMVGRDDDVNQLSSGGFPWNGVIDEVRWSKVARYAGAYAPATVPFVSDANTLLLAHLDAIPSGAGTPGRARVAPTVGALNVWTDITQYVIGGTYSEGRQHELSRFEAGEASLTVDNTLAEFHPWNTSGPFAGLLNPMVPIQIRRVWSGVVYPEYTGYVYAWPQKWPDQVNATTEIRAADAFRLMALANISGSVYADLVNSTAPANYWRLGDINTTVAVDSTGRANGTFYGGSQGVQGALLSDADNAYDAGNYAGYIDLPTASACPAGNTGFTIKGWVKLHAAPSSVGSDRIYAATNFGGAVTLVLYVMQSSGDPGGHAGLYFSASDATHNTIANGAGNTFVDQAIPLDGKWHQFACTRDNGGTVYSTYIDGVLKLQQTLGSVITLTALSVASIGGITAGSNPQAMLNGAVDELTIHNVTLTAAQILADYNAGVGLWASSDTGTRVGNVLDAIGWPKFARNIQSGVTTVPAVPSSLVNTKSLQYMQTLESTEAGALFMGGDGRVNFLNRNSIVTGSVTPQLVFGDGGGSEFPFQPSPEQAEDDTDIWNESVVQRQGGLNQRAYDSTSGKAYGRRTMPNRSGLLYSSDTDSLYRAQWDVERYKQPIHRVSSIQARPLIQPAQVPALLGLTLLSCVQVHRANMPGTPLQQNSLVEGKHVKFDAESGDWIVGFSLSPTEARPYWILGDSTFGVLGSTTRLRF